MRGTARLAIAPRGAGSVAADGPAPRRRRARLLRELRAVPAALPDVPGDGGGGLLAPRTHRRDAIGAVATVRRGGDEFVAFMETCVQCRGCEPACPSGVPFGHLMEGTRRALASEHRTTSRLQRMALASARKHRLLLAGSSVLALAQRLRLVPRRLGLAAAPAAAWRGRHRARPAPIRRVAVHRLRDGRLDAPHPRGDEAGDRGRRWACVQVPGRRGRLLRRAAHPRRPARRGRRARPEGDGVDAGRGADRRQLRRLRCGDEGLRPPARHRRRRAAFARGCSTSTSGSRRASTAPGTDRAPLGPVIVQDPCHLRHVQKAHALGACRARPRRRRGRARRRWPVLRRGRRLLRARNPSSPARSETARWPPSSAPSVASGATVVASRQPGLRDAPRRRRHRRCAIRSTSWRRCCHDLERPTRRARRAARGDLEELGDLAIVLLRDAIADGATSRPAQEKRLAQARRAVDKASHLLAALRPWRIRARSQPVADSRARRRTCRRRTHARALVNAGACAREAIVGLRGERS